MQRSGVILSRSDGVKQAQCSNAGEMQIFASTRCLHGMSRSFRLRRVATLEQRLTIWPVRCSQVPVSCWKTVIICDSSRRVPSAAIFG